MMQYSSNAEKKLRLHSRSQHLMAYAGRMLDENRLKPRKANSSHWRCSEERPRQPQTQDTQEHQKRGKTTKRPQTLKPEVQKLTRCLQSAADACDVEVNNLQRATCESKAKQSAC
ncbi:unnamed protein product [Polarella glacialis]|uniref:Uncharacterized protein n=1 Tax=Polarella glacialis TaxID=89957 RepID=A0A813JA88_POLGL|nr:unnamed protein product [Polarella glacialis]